VNFQAAAVVIDKSPNADARISIMVRANAQGPDLLQTDRD